MLLHRAERIIATAAVMMAVFVLLSMNASADPIGTKGWYDSFSEAFMWIFFSNLPVNLMWFSGVLLVICYAFGPKVGRISQKTTIFISEVFVVGLILTALGVLIDMTLLLARYPLGYIVYYDPLNWFAASALIFVSIYLSSALLLDIDPKLNLIPAVAMAVMNLIWWDVAITRGPYIAAIMSPLSILLAPIFLGALWAWHHKKFHGVSAA